MLSIFQRTFYRTYATKVRTVDPNQIKHFNNLVEQWWDQSGGLALLHEFNKYRIPWIQDSLMEINAVSPQTKQTGSLSGLSVLEVGCGGGILCEPLSRLECKTTGIDASEELINLAKWHARNENLPNLQYFCSTVQHYANQNQGKHDVVVSSETIEHVTEKEEFIRDCVRCLKPGGSIFMTTPNRTWLTAFWIIFMMENVFKIIPKGTHQYEMFLHVEDLKKILQKENCRIVHTRGFTYDPFRKTWKFVNNLRFSYGIHAVKEK